MRHNRNGQIRGLYAVTPDEPDTEELLRKSRLVLQGGAGILQYRNKVADVPLRLAQASALRELTRDFSALLIVNDDAALARRVDADGVHIGSGDGDIAAARAKVGDDKLVGVSCYNRPALAREAAQQGADYVAFGSFFDSLVKPEAVVASPGLLRQARGEIAVPLVAIGGITLRNAALLLDAGANALAVISAVFGADDIREAARQFSSFNYPETNSIDR